MALRWPDKDPNDRLNYTIDGSRAFASTENITAVTWTVPSGLTNEATSISGQQATIILSGGTAGQTYTLTARITTDANTPNNIWERDITLRVRNL